MFEYDETYAKWVAPQPWWGEYLATYKSEGGQVKAYLFRQVDRLVARVFFLDEYFPTNTTDHYGSDLRGYAREHGYGDKFDMIYIDK